jgi:hypothetical protein
MLLVLVGSVEGENLGPRRISAVDRKRSAFCGIVSMSLWEGEGVGAHNELLRLDLLASGVFLLQDSDQTQSRGTSTSRRWIFSGSRSPIS